MNMLNIEREPYITNYDNLLANLNNTRLMHQPPYYATSWQEHDEYVEFYCSEEYRAGQGIEEPYGEEANMLDEMEAIEQNINNIDIW